MNHLVHGILPPCPSSSLDALEVECEERAFLDLYLLPVKMHCKHLRLLKAFKSRDALQEYIVSKVKHKYYKWVKRKPSRIKAFLSSKKEVKCAH